MKRKLDIVVISDTHLGTYGCHAKQLSNYLKSIKPNILILKRMNNKWLLQKLPLLNTF